MYQKYFRFLKFFLKICFMYTSKNCCRINYIYIYIYRERERERENDYLPEWMGMSIGCFMWHSQKIILNLFCLFCLDLTQTLPGNGEAIWVFTFSKSSMPFSIFVPLLYTACSWNNVPISCCWNIFVYSCFLILFVRILCI